MRIAVLLACLSMLLPVSARADTASVTPGNPKVTWDGARFRDAVTPGPEACLLEAGLCDTFDFSVAFGGSASALSTIQVGIKWKDETVAESESEYDDFDLYVYDEAGRMVASSANPRASSMGIASTAEVTDMPVVDGDYTAVVVPTNVLDRAYHGVVMLQTNVPARNGYLLPDLFAYQPTGFHFAHGTLSLSRTNTDLRSCYTEETLQDEGNPTRCLRFDAGHGNIGHGAFLLDVDLSTATPNYPAAGQLGGEVTQAIQSSDGTEFNTPAGTYVFHPNHGHIHYKGFAEYALYAVNADGTRGALVRPSRKSDFCMIDVDDLWFGLPGNQPRDHHFPQCNLSEGAEPRQRQGINRGWGDVYTWDLPGQYIDVTGVPDGDYDVVNTANPDGLINEMTTSNNEAATRIWLVGDTVTCIPTPYGCPAGSSTP